MEDLIVSLQIMVDAWRKLPDGVGSVQVAADQLEGVIENHKSRLTMRAADSYQPTELREDDDSCQCLMCGDVHRRR